MGREVRIRFDPRLSCDSTTNSIRHVSAYLLASCALSPFYGRISDLIGRKTVLYPVIVIFLVREVESYMS